MQMETREGDEYVHHCNCGDGFNNIYIHQNLYYFNVVQFTLTQPYLKKAVKNVWDPSKHV